MMLVGRDRELAALTDASERAARGNGGQFALIGEAGIGKTRLSDELSDQCARRGFAVHWGRAWETGGAPAYWPWTKLLDSIRAADPLLVMKPALAPLLSRGDR